MSTRLSALVPRRFPAFTWRDVWTPVTSDWSRALAFLILALFFGLVLFQGLLPIPLYSHVDLMQALAPPSLQNPFGRDSLGRSILSGVIDGTRTELYVIVFTVGLAAVIGYAIGMLAGYIGGIVDQVLMRCIDVLLSFPSIFLALAVVSSAGPGLQSAALAMAVAQVAPFARLMRAQVLSANKSLYVLNARVIGLPHWRVMSRHVFPNIWGPLVVQLTFATGTSILGVASLGFLGLGADPTTPDWGAMIYANRLYVTTAVYTVIFPGLAIFATVFAFNVVGESLRDRFDPRSKAKYEIS
jgi:peptide/nickel transport system permease protein